MELNKLYSIANKENITILENRMSNKAIICEINNNYYVGLNYLNINDSREEKEILAEELGHYYMDATYKYNSDMALISKQEYRAKKWSYNTLVPFENLKLAILKRG